MKRKIALKYHKLITILLLIAVSVTFFASAGVGLLAAPNLTLCTPYQAFVKQSVTAKAGNPYLNGSFSNSTIIDQLAQALGLDSTSIFGRIFNDNDQGQYNVGSIYSDPSSGPAESIVMQYGVDPAVLATLDLSQIRVTYNFAAQNQLQQNLPRVGWTTLNASAQKNGDGNVLTVTIPKSSIPTSGGLATIYIKLLYHDTTTNSDLAIKMSDGKETNCGMFVMEQLQTIDKVYANTSCSSLGLGGSYAKSNNKNNNYFTCKFVDGQGWTAVKDENSCAGSDWSWSHCGGKSVNINAAASGQDKNEFAQYGDTFCAPCLPQESTALSNNAACTAPASTGTGLDYYKSLNQCGVTNAAGSGATPSRNLTCVPGVVTNDTRCLYAGANKPGLGGTCVVGQRECAVGTCLLPSGQGYFSAGAIGSCVDLTNNCATFDAISTVLQANDASFGTKNYSTFLQEVTKNGTGTDCKVVSAPRCGGKDSISGTAAKVSNSNQVRVLLSGCLADAKYGYLQAKYYPTVGAPNGETANNSFQDSPVISLSNIGKFTEYTLLTSGQTNENTHYIRVCGIPLTSTVPTSSAAPDTLCTNIAVSGVTESGGDTGNTGGDTGTDTGSTGQQGREACTSIEDTAQATQCDSCLIAGGTWTGLGCIATTPEGIFSSIIRIVLGTMGGVALLRVIYLGYLYQSKDEKKIAEARAGVISTLAGILVVLFSVLILRIIGVNILNVVPAGFFG